MSTTEATHNFTPDEIALLIEQIQTSVDRGNDKTALYLVYLAQTKALAEIAFQLAKLNRLLESGVDQHTGCFVTRPAEF